MRREEKKNAQLFAERFIGDLEARLHEQDGGMRIGGDFLDDAVTTFAIRICQAIKQCSFFGIIDRVFQIPPLLVAKRLPVGNQELEISRVGLIDMRIINLVDDAVRDRVPEPATGVIGRPDPFFRALGPARLRSGRAEGLFKRRSGPDRFDIHDVKSDTAELRLPRASSVIMARVQ